MSTFEENYTEIVGTKEDLDALEEFLSEQWDSYRQQQHEDVDDEMEEEEEDLDSENEVEEGEDVELDGNIFDGVEWGEDDWGYRVRRTSPTTMTFHLKWGAVGADFVIADAASRFESVTVVSYTADQEQNMCWISPPGIDLGYWAFPKNGIEANHNSYFLSYVKRKYAFSTAWAKPLLGALGLDGETDKKEMEDLFNHTAILIKAGFISEPADDPSGWGKVALTITGSKTDHDQVESRLRQIAPKVKDNFLYEEICLLRGVDGTATMQVLCRQGELDGLVGKLQEEFPLITIEQTWEALITDSE